MIKSTPDQSNKNAENHKKKKKITVEASAKILDPHLAEQAFKLDSSSDDEQSFKEVSKKNTEFNRQDFSESLTDGFKTVQSREPKQQRPPDQINGFQVAQTKGKKKGKLVVEADSALVDEQIVNQPIKFEEIKVQSKQPPK